MIPSQIIIHFFAHSISILGLENVWSEIETYCGYLSPMWFLQLAACDLTLANRDIGKFIL